MLSSNKNLARDRPLSFAIPAVASAATLALLLVSSTSSPFWCDAKNITTSQIFKRRNQKNSVEAVENSANNATVASTTATYDYNSAIYHQLGVQPPHNSTKVLKFGFGFELPLARWSWKIHGRLLPLLHFFERGRPDDVFVNLRVLWCKLLISLDPKSIAYEGRRTSWQQKGKDEKNSYGGSSRCSNDVATGDEGQLYATYRMLPHYSIKWALRYLGLWKAFPRWMHANIELRIVYLQTALEKVLESRRYNRQIRPNNRNEDDDNLVPAVDTIEREGVTEKNLDGERICVIILGGGYDPRGAKLSVNDGNWPNAKVERVYELDLPLVADSKRKLLLRAGFDVIDDSSDNKNNNGRQGVRLEGVDLNDDIAVDRVLDKIRQELIAIHSPADNLNPFDSDMSTPKVSALTKSKSQWHIVLISEAVFLYLDPGKAERIVQGVSERFRAVTSKDNKDDCFSGASFVFADRLLPRKKPVNATANASARRGMSLPLSPELIEIEETEVRRWLQDKGWELDELLLKPGATRHLGIATTT